MTVRVRIAPSPTGDPHVGTGYIGLFNMVYARHHGGQFILRIEDTDQTRSTRESEAAILRSLSWLGLTWDEGPDVGGPHGPYRQSERTAIYQQHAELLIERGTAYRCFCTEERLASLRAEQVQKGDGTRYDRHCRHLSRTEAAERLKVGEPHVIRLAFPLDGETVVRDERRGNIIIDNAQIDDQILLKSDGFPTYHLANVVDDHLMEITDVIRAEEWISSTPKHVRLYEAFGWVPPRFWHMPLLRNSDKSKISKRKNPVSLDYYERIGILPEAMLNYLGQLGWSIGEDREKFTVAEMVEAFTFDRMSLTGPVFDLQKLQHLNGLYIRELSDEVLVERLVQSYLSPERLRELMPLFRERIERLDQFVPMTTYLLGGDLQYDWQLLIPAKKFSGTAEDVRLALLEAAERLDGVRSFDHETLEATLRQLALDIGWKPGHLFTPIRVAVAGRTAAPPLFDTMVAIGAPLCRARLRDAAALLHGKTPADAG